MNKETIIFHETGFTTSVSIKKSETNSKYSILKMIIDGDIKTYEDTSLITKEQIELMRDKLNEFLEKL